MNTSNTLEICSNLEKISEQYGNINFINKEELYLLIDYIRENFKIDINEVFNVPKFCQDNFKDIIEYDFHKFNDTKIGGFLIKNKFPEKSYITINSSKESICSIFDLTHEMIHFLLHPEDRKHYISSTLCDIDNFEWQANEGAAELLVPYKRFIPDFVKSIQKCHNRKDYNDLLFNLSNKYVVSIAVLEYRITSLKYEIHQYEEGVSIDKIQFLSKRMQEDQGIYITSYNEIFKNKKMELKSIISNFSSDTISHSPTEISLTNSNSSSNLEQLKFNTWNDVLNYFKATGRIMLYMNLADTKLYVINSDTVGIEFSNNVSEFRKVLLRREANLNEITNSINILFNKKMNIKFIENSSSQSQGLDINIPIKIIE